MLAKPPSCPILQPIIDLLQYQVFCERVKFEVDKITRALSAAGISSVLRFSAVGEVGQDLVKLLDEGSTTYISGEAVLRVDDRFVCGSCHCGTRSLMCFISATHYG